MWFLLYRITRRGTENGLCLPECRDQGECRVIVNGYGVSFWNDENVLKLDIDDGYTTL